MGPRELPAQLLPDLRRAPARILPLQADDGRFNRRGQAIRLAIGPPAPIGECGEAGVFIAVKNLVAGLPRDAEFGAQRRHLLALEQAGDKPESLVHDVTLLPRHAPSCGGKVSPIRSEYAVTCRSGRTLVDTSGRRRPPPTGWWVPLPLGRVGFRPGSWTA